MEEVNIQACISRKEMYVGGYHRSCDPTSVNSCGGVNVWMCAFSRCGTFVSPAQPQVRICGVLWWYRFTTSRG
eukprot:461675-Prymnesium_polylepis.1